MQFMTRKNNIWLLMLLFVILATACNRNYYSGNGKGSNCGCPSKKGMVGY
jgi:hypothetical protein